MIIYSASDLPLELLSLGYIDQESAPSHPRYASLRRREQLVSGFNRGIVVPQGLIAHGRGEMFDYLLGEVSLQDALTAERAAAAHLLAAERPVISVNGNVAALCPETIVRLSDMTDAAIEISLFHWSVDRLRLIRETLLASGAREVLAENPDRDLDGVSSSRGKCHDAGIYSADVVLVPLEDGDRAEALAAMNKTVISIDLNPLSRTSLCAHISIVDELTRAVPNIIAFAEELKGDQDTLAETLRSFDNKRALHSIYAHIADRLAKLSEG